ncbi:MAG TPA: SDR family NAD(P)-dependent oxidoreductase [Gemmatimonadaceae bacterium]|nr:SDR family NAD(P)-dependent oxidoreductase [Gemmatimonadaceae bacterium]
MVSISAADPERLAADALAAHPGFGAELELLAHCGRHLAGILRGVEDSREVLFAPDALPLLERMYHGSATSAFNSALAAAAVAAVVKSAGADRPLRVLEVGGGTGGTTAFVLPLLAGLGVEYVFTDVTAFFTERAAASLPADAGLVTRTLDIERDPTEQGMAAGLFDLVLAANVVHATRAVAESIANLKTLLAPGGALVLQEITRRPFWLDMVFGLTDGWWRFADRHLRTEHPLLTPDGWRDVLTRQGFEDPVVLADEPDDGVAAQSVIIARVPIVSSPAGDGLVRGHYLVLSDQRGVGDRLAGRMRACGLGCTLVRAADVPNAAAFARLLGETLANRPEFRGIVHLWGVDAPGPDANVADVMRAQRAGCGSIIDLVHAFAERSNHAAVELWLISAGSQKIEAADDVPGVIQGALWGLGRTLMREADMFRCRLVELGTIDPELDALVREMTMVDGAEEEIAFRGPRRYVRRLRRLPPATGRHPAELRAPRATEEYTAFVGTPGALETVVLRARGASVPGPDDVLVRIKATALNFRDIMLAMGMLPPNASDGTFGRGLLGMDCAGVVEAVGEAVRDVKPGDDVVAAAVACLGSHVLTHQMLVLRKPSALTFEQAAAIPVAWVTAYYALRRLSDLRAGERVLIHSAAGGVGLAAIQIARAAGAEVFATAGSEDKRAYLRSLGVAHVMDSRSVRFADEVRAATSGEGVDVVLNSLSGEAIVAGLSLLRSHGRFVEIGKSDIYQDSPVGLLALRKNISLFVLDIDRMCQERPSVIRECMGHVLDGMQDGRYTPLPEHVFPMSRLEDALRFMAHAKHIGKIVVRTGDPEVRVMPAADATPPFRAGGTYVISGGLGGFGIALAGHMADRGARSIALLGRGDPGTEAETALGMLRARGVRVEAIRCDVARAEDVERALARVRRDMAPIRGIVHAAMVLDDVSIAETTYERFEAVLAPKVAGAWNLQKATLNDALEHFVLFSSIASMLGNPLQANYCAANTFLDGLAQHMRARGRPALAVYWGVLADTGYVARTADVGEYLEAQGYMRFTPQQALAALDDLLGRDLASAAASRFDWARWALASPAIATSPRFRHLVPTSDPTVSGPGGGLASARAMIASSPAAKRQAAAEHFLREKVGKVLGMAPARIDCDRPLTDIGFDSLLAVELVTILKLELGVDLKVLRLLQGITLAGLTDAVLDQIAASATPAGRPDSTTRRAAGPSTAGTLAAVVDGAGGEVPAAPAVSAAAPLGTTQGAAPADGATGTTRSDRVNDAFTDAPSNRNGAPDRRPRVDYASLDYSRWDADQRLVRGLLAAALHSTARIAVDGRAHVPRLGGVIVAVNHLSALDAPILFTVFSRRATLFVKEKYASTPIIGRVLTSIGQVIYLRSEDDNVAALDDGLTVLRSGGILGIGPEGRRSRTGGLEPAQPGVAYLVARSGAPVLPIAMWGQERIGAGVRRLRRSEVRVSIGPPMRFPPTGAGRAELDGITERIMLTLAAMLPVDYRGVYREKI